MPEWSYRGRWALVTGASSGIGEAFARELARRGTHLVLTARREDRLLELADHLRAAHRVRTLVVPEDLADPGGADRLWARAAAGREIDLLVNNAGFGAQGRFDAIEGERQAAMVRLNCVAPLELAHHALRAMRPRRRGGVVNVASLAAFQPMPGLATYAASKAFLLSFSQALWAENRDAGIRVVALCPGRTPTAFQAAAGTGSAEGAFGVRSREEIVRAALDGLASDRHTVVPGLENRLAGWVAGAVPRTPLLRVLGSLVERAARRGVD